MCLTVVSTNGREPVAARKMKSDPKPIPRKTHCKRGHSLEDAYVSNDGRRHCRTCANMRNKQWRLRHPERREREREKERLAYQAAKGSRTVPCRDCGVEITVFSTLTQRRCASCRDERYRKPKTCPVCETVFISGYGNRNTCSMKCRNRKLSLDRGGDGNPSFKTGKRVGVHIPGWRKQAKGEYACRNCGSREWVQLHHAIPRSKWKAGEADLRNALPLCHDCHMGWHHRKMVIYRDIFKEEEWKFLCSATPTGENIGPWLDARYPARPLVDYEAADDD